MANNGILQCFAHAVGKYSDAIWVLLRAIKIRSTVDTRSIWGPTANIQTFNNILILLHPTAKQINFAINDLHLGIWVNCQRLCG